MEIKLKLKIKDVEIELSTDEAKKLIEVLRNLVEPVYVPSAWCPAPTWIDAGQMTVSTDKTWYYVDARYISDNVSVGYLE